MAALVNISVQVVNQYYIHVSHSGNDSVILRSLSPVVDAVFFKDPDREDESVVLYCITEDGSLYRVDTRQFNRRVKSSDVDSDSANREIFSDLLSVDDDGIVLETSTELVYLLEPVDKIHQCNDRPLSLCVFDTFLAIAATSKAGNAVHIFDHGKMLQAELPPIAESFLRLPWKGCNTDKEPCSPLEKVISKVVVLNQPEVGRVCSNSVLSVDKTFFKQLFGQDCTLLNSPIIIVASPEGTVYFAPVNQFIPTETQTHLNQHDPGSMASRWTVLCQMSTKVTDIFTLSLSLKHDIESRRRQGNEPEATDAADSLLVSSEGGVITVLDKNANHQSSGSCISTLTVSYPLICCAAFGSRLYHSTGTEVFESKLEKMEAGVKVAATRRFGLVSIVQIQPLYQDENIYARDSHCSRLACSTMEGDTKVISLEVTNEQKTAPVVSGETIQNLLTSLEELDAKHRELQDQLCFQDYWLKQMHLLAYLSMCCSRLSEIEGNQYTEDLSQENPFSCTCICTYQSDINSFTSELTLTNQMAVPLSHDWTILVEVVPGGRSEDIPLWSKSQRLSKALAASKSVTITMAVDVRIVLSGAKVLVFAVLNMPDPVEHLKLVALPVKVCQLSLDVLNFLRPGSDIDLFEDSEGSRTGALQDSVRQIAKTKPAAKILGLDTNCQEDTNSETQNVTVLNHLSLDKNSSHYLQKTYGSSLPYSMLKMLLKDAASDIVITSQSDSQCTCNCTVLNRPVQLTAGETTPHSLADTRETIHARELKMTMTSQADISTAAALHKSIAARLKSMQSFTRPCKMKVKQGKKLLQSLQDVRDQLVQWERRPMSRSQTLALLGSVYQNIRSGQCYT